MCESFFVKLYPTYVTDLNRGQLGSFKKVLLVFRAGQMKRNLNFLAWSTLDLVSYWGEGYAILILNILTVYHSITYIFSVTKVLDLIFRHVATLSKVIP